jgi:hypothetical protein
MKVAHPPLIGSFFLPTLGFAVFSLALGYWISRRKKGNVKNNETNIKENCSSDMAGETDSPSALENVKGKKKKHQCSCGSKETSKFEKQPSEIKIMYGTLMGKSKVE